MKIARRKSNVYGRNDLLDLWKVWGGVGMIAAIIIFGVLLLVVAGLVAIT